MAIAGKLDHKDYRVYAILDDGEIEEGQVWKYPKFLSATFIGKVGNDFFGHALKQILNDNRVNTDDLLLSDIYKTTFYFGDCRASKRLQSEHENIS